MVALDITLARISRRHIVVTSLLRPVGILVVRFHLVSFSDAVWLDLVVHTLESRIMALQTLIVVTLSLINHLLINRLLLIAIVSVVLPFPSTSVVVTIFPILVLLMMPALIRFFIRIVSVIIVRILRRLFF